MEGIISGDLPLAIPAWVQSEVASSHSAPQQIPPEMHKKVFSWAEVKDLVEKKRLEVIRRKPSERVVYKAWCKDIINAYGSITVYLYTERLQWTPLPSSSAETGPIFEACDPAPFRDPRDYRILRNDWPYGSFEAGITHLIVWSKPRIPTYEETGLPTTEAGQLIEDFVQKIFVSRLEREAPGASEKVVWFKNWDALQSVKGLEHIHVLVKDVPEAIVDEWTGEEALQS